MDCIKVQEKKKKVTVCFRSRQNVKLGTFTLYGRSFNDGQEMYKKACCFANLNLLLFCCCRCRRRRRCLNFLITICIYLFAGASYTANLASFLITDVFDTPIDSLEDLASQTKIKYGCIKDSHIMTFFQMSHVPVHAKMWAFMQRHDTLVKNMTEGIQRAKEGGYAFIGESEMLEYYTKQKPCDTLTTIGR